MSAPNPPPDFVEQVARALAEDVGGGDLTAALVPAGRQGRATVITREAAVLCGRPWFERCVATLRADPSVIDCGGPMRAVGYDFASGVVADLLNSPLGVGSARYRYASKPIEAELMQ